MKNILLIVFIAVTFINIKAQNTFPSTGNVGIGTTSPNASLDVLRGTASWGTAVFRGTKRFTHFNHADAEHTYIRGGKANSNVFLNDNGGNVGVRHTAPNATLDVARGTASWGTAVFRGTKRFTHFNHADAEHTYIRGGKANSNVFLNDNGGNVGVRHTAPNATLDVARGTASWGTAVFRGTKRFTHFNHADAEHTYIRGGKANSNVFLNDNGGNVGVRHTAPNATLDVARGTASWGTAVFRGTKRFTHFNHADAEHTYIRGGKANSNVFLNDNGGNVGVRHTAPNATLDVARGTASWGTAVFRGTKRFTHFNHADAEHTYIRGGKANSNVFLNDNGGNVGVRHTAPNATLDVARGTASWGTAVFRGTKRFTHFNHADAEHTYIRGGKANSNVFLNDNGGNVGVRHTAPNATLDVARGTASWGTAVFRGTKRFTHFNHADAEHTYIRGGKANSNVFLNDNGGNVGVRHTAPNATLDVARGTASWGTAVFRGTKRFTHFNHADAEHTYIRGGKANSNVFLNDNGGNVGVRHTAPNATLDVARGTASWGTAVFRGTKRFTHFNHADAEHTYIRGGKANSNVFLNDNGGNVGVRHTAPNATLDVARGTASWGTAVFRGTKRFTHFNHADAEHTYIRGGKPNSNVYLNDNGGNVGIGTTSTGSHKLAVEGSIGAREINVEAGSWSDFVFEKDYKLPSLSEVESHIHEKGHLKDIPSTEEVENEGINLGEMDAKLLQKIEELTLYLIQQNKEIKTLKDQNKKIVELEEKIKKLEAGK